MKMTNRNWRLLAYNLILQLSNELEIDPAEILNDYGFTDRELKNFYDFCRSIKL